MPKYIFAIDTNEYAGNFEREMTAYITGQVGECGVGQGLVPLYVKETGDTDCTAYDEFIEFRPDDRNGCRRPCTIYPTPGWFNHGLGGHFKEGDDARALKDYAKQAQAIYGDYQKPTKAIKKLIEAGQKVEGWTLKACNADIASHQKDIDAAKKAKRVKKYPAYLSVAIYFDKKPTSEMIAQMKERAEKYAKVCGTDTELFRFSPKKLKITGFRLITETSDSSAESV